MLDIALSFLADQLNAYLRTRGALTGDADMVRLQALVNDKGEWLLPIGAIGITLVNVEEERTTREQLPERVYRDGQHIVLPPPLKLNLTVLFTARFANETGANYKTSLQYLSHILTFFQAKPSFSSDSYPELSPSLEKLNIDLLSSGPEQLNQIWAYLGAKYLPSALYKVRLVALQDQQPQAFEQPITEIQMELHRL